jgi:hypothetical protein
MEWKWTKGEPYERSRRIFKNETTEIDEKFSKEVETSAYSSALNYDENTWDMLNQELSNKREDLDFKIAERGPVQQIGNNPFLGQNNYVNDIVVSNNFLKPVNTSHDRAKEDSSSKQTSNTHGM